MTPEERAYEDEERDLVLSGDVFDLRLPFIHLFDRLGAFDLGRRAQRAGRTVSPRQMLNLIASSTECALIAYHEDCENPRGWWQRHFLVLPNKTVSTEVELIET